MYRKLDTVVNLLDKSNSISMLALVIKLTTTATLLLKIPGSVVLGFPMVSHSKVNLSSLVVHSSKKFSLYGHLDELQDVLLENIQMHDEMIKESENLFYGYYSPDGIREWDVTNAPSAWIHYSLSPDLSNTAVATRGQSNFSPTIAKREDTNRKFSTVWESLMELDQRTIPPPFSNDDLARVSLHPILTAEECQDIINECENHYWGWGSSNERYGTPAERVGHMLKLEDLSQSYSLVNFTLLPRLFPAIANAFPNISLQPEHLRLGGGRVVKYDASEGRVELGMHRDGLLVTANIALNAPNEYVGGGTIVEGVSASNEPIRMDRGHVLLHPGDVKHGGSPITHGIRYVLVLFLFATNIVPHEKYCQDRMERDVEAARAIPVNDATRAQERDELFSSAMKHCADAYAFRHWSTEKKDGFENAMVRSFEKLGILSTF